MKYWELNTGDWFYVDEKPYIKIKEPDGTAYCLSLVDFTCHNFKFETEVNFCSSIDYVDCGITPQNKDVYVIQSPHPPNAFPNIPLQKIGDDAIIVKYKYDVFWMYAIIYGKEQGKSYLLSRLDTKKNMWYSYTEFHRTFPENT